VALAAGPARSLSTATIVIDIVSLWAPLIKKLLRFVLNL
jgi:hypothetical protein